MIDDRVKARLDMIEPGIFFVLCETTNGGITGRSYTSVAEALDEVRKITASHADTSHAFGLAA